MADFMIRFLICNIVLGGIIGILLAAKQLFKNSLSPRMQYQLWFLLLGLLAVPFLPFPLTGFSQIASWLGGSKNSPAAATGMEETVKTYASQNADWMNDFTLSANSGTPPVVGYLLFAIWIAGILAMLALMIKSALRLRTLEQSALPLQNKKVRILYRRCLDEMRIHREIPLYSTAFLQSPVIVGFLKPRIYLPIHLIAETAESDLRYMLLHELSHYKHRDAVGVFLMNLAGVVYWFHPLVWYALKEMRSDREIACDTSVLKMLEEDACEDYGNTLINFAEKMSRTPFPFAVSLGGSMKQMRRRILNIVSYEKPTFAKNLRGMAAFVLTAALLLGLTPFVSTYAADQSRYRWEVSQERVSTKDFQEQFGAYTGSFVLYDLKNDHWLVSDKEQAVTRAAPDSTYKIYDALFALDAGIISPERTQIAWDQTAYPFEAWNTDQTLNSAMVSSVNWYFQSLDKRMGRSALQSYIRSIGYGNQDIHGSLSSYWLESSLKISAVEQVELLAALYQNDLPFAAEHIAAVKDSIRLFSSDAGTFYGKTGTGQVDGQNVNGWFVGILETTERTYFFATNIHAKHSATGSAATQLTMEILAELHLWERETD